MSRPVVTPNSAARITGMLRVVPAPDLADVVDQHWIVAWDHRGRPPVSQDVLPDPCVNLAIEPAGRLLYGVGSGRSVHELAGAGMVVGTKLRAHRPTPDPQRELVAEIVEVMRVVEPGTRVTDVAARFGLSPRTLQRLFAQHVGTGPKQVLQRFRRQDATDRLSEAGSANLARLAAELGYFDQAHFARDFRAVLGRSPSAVATAS